LLCLAFVHLAVAQAPASPQGVVVQEIARAQATALGQRIELPGGGAEVIASIFTIAPGAELPVHKHRFPRYAYAYVLSGRVGVTGDDGRVSAYEAGAFIVEMVDMWHRGSNACDEPARLLVIDQVEPGASNTIVKEP
jgi:quercetin dioxygenase-like cupin family protein